jgi:hypothetical protein
MGEGRVKRKRGGKKREKRTERRNIRKNRKIEIK